LSFENKNPKTKIKILFWIKKSEIENNTLKKNLKERLLCSGNKNLEKKNEKPIPDKKIHNIKIYSRKKKSRTHILEKGVRSFYICIYFFLENFRLFWNGVQ